MNAPAGSPATTKSANLAASDRIESARSSKAPPMPTTAIHSAAKQLYARPLPRSTEPRVYVRHAEKMGQEAA